MKDFKVMGISLPIFIIIGSVLLLGANLGAVPSGMIGVLAVMISLGAVLGLIGDNLPIVKDYLGGGPIVIIFASAALVYFNVLPKSMILSIKTFMESGTLKGVEGATVGFKAGFLDFYIAALITGSILGMSRNLLVKAAVRFIPTILGGVVLSLGFVGITGALVGFGLKEAIYYVGIPIMGGGMGAGAVPLAEIFGGSLGVEPATVLSKLVPAVALGNALAIVFGGLLEKFGKAKPQFSGEGKLMRGQVDMGENEKEEKLEDNAKHYGVGILISCTFMVLGTIIAKFVPDVHAYAWMIISVGVVKALGILPRYYELCCQKWYGFVAANFTSALLVGIGIAYTDLGQVIDSISLIYLLLVFVTVLGAVIGSGIVGKWLGFYEIEAAITAGLCMANMGGTGDVAVLSAAKRMELMPFAQISSRIGGTIILLIASALVSILG